MAVRLATLARVINEKVPGFKAQVVEGYCNTDRRIPGSRLRHQGKGRYGGRLIVKDQLGRTLIDHNSAETYRTNREVMDLVERYWGPIWLPKVLKPVHRTMVRGSCGCCDKCLRGYSANCASLRPSDDMWTVSR